MAASGLSLAQLVDHIEELIALARKGDAFALDDAMKHLRELRKAVTTTSKARSSVARSDQPRIRKSWRDAVALYKWAREQTPRGSTMREIHTYLVEHKAKYPGELRKCRLAKWPYFKKAVERGLKAQRTSHRERNSARA